MVGRVLFSLLTVVIVIVVTVEQTRAGGWASVTLDTPPAEVRAGEAIRVGFTVKQHDVTPIHDVWGQPVELTIRAWLPKKGLEVQVAARKDPAKVGRFTADLTFPSAGVWEWEATPAPFAKSVLPPVTVVEGAAAPVGAAAEAQLGATQAWAGAGREDRSGTIVGVLGLGALVVAAGGMILMLRRRAA